VASALALPVLWLAGLSILAAIPAIERLRGPAASPTMWTAPGPTMGSAR
jgi:hypothetical protein